MKKIKLTRGEYALVDDADYAVLSVHKWTFDGRYAIRRVGGKKIYMHRLVTGNQTGLDTDHINRNKLDNRRSNLRICDRTANNFNQPIRADNTSGSKGISWRKDSQKWRARIGDLTIGLFEDIQDAINAREQYLENIS